jgi:predicted DNA-binding antitoxin AbrB/MazE fold protein
MMKTIHAIYENGVFRPTEPVDLPDRTAVEFEPRVQAPAAPMSEGLAKIYAILRGGSGTGPLLAMWASRKVA